MDRKISLKLKKGENLQIVKTFVRFVKKINHWGVCVCKKSKKKLREKNMALMKKWSEILAIIIFLFVCLFVNYKLQQLSGGGGCRRR